MMPKRRQGLHPGIEGASDAEASSSFAADSYIREFLPLAFVGDRLVASCIGVRLTSLMGVSWNLHLE
jgi:hypothetical protein